MTDWTSPEGRAELARLAAAATPGPWAVNTDDGRRNAAVDAEQPYVTHHLESGGRRVATVWDRGQKKNRHFIAAARTAVPQLLALIADLEARLAAAGESSPAPNDDCLPTLMSLRGLSATTPPETPA